MATKREEFFAKQKAMVEKEMAKRKEEEAGYKVTSKKGKVTVVRGQPAIPIKKVEVKAIVQPQPVMATPEVTTFQKLTPDTVRVTEGRITRDVGIGELGKETMGFTPAPATPLTPESEKKITPGITFEKVTPEMLRITSGGKTYAWSMEAFSRGEMPPGVTTPSTTRIPISASATLIRKEIVKPLVTKEIIQPERVGGPSISDIKPPLQYNPATQNYYVSYGGKNYPISQEDYAANRLSPTVMTGLQEQLKIGKQPTVIEAVKIPITEKVKPSVTETTLVTPDSAKLQNYMQRAREIGQKIETQKAMGIFATPEKAREINVEREKLIQQFKVDYPDLDIESVIEKPSTVTLGGITQPLLRKAEEAAIEKPAKVLSILPGMGIIAEGLKQIPKAEIKPAKTEFEQKKGEYENISVETLKKAGWTGKATAGETERLFLSPGEIKAGQKKVTTMLQKDVEQRVKEVEKYIPTIEKFNEENIKVSKQGAEIANVITEYKLQEKGDILKQKADAFDLAKQRYEENPTQAGLNRHDDAWLDYQNALNDYNSAIEKSNITKRQEEFDKNVKQLEAKYEIAKLAEEKVLKAQREADWLQWKAGEEIEQIKMLDPMYVKQKEAQKQWEEALAMKGPRGYLAKAATGYQKLGIDVGAPIARGAGEFLVGGLGRELSKEVTADEKVTAVEVLGAVGKAILPPTQIKYRAKALYETEPEGLTPWERISGRQVGGALTVATFGVGALPAGATGAIAATKVGKVISWGLPTIAGAYATPKIARGAEFIVSPEEEKQVMAKQTEFRQLLAAGFQAEDIERKKSGIVTEWAGYVPGLPLIPESVPVLGGVQKVEAFEEGVRKKARELGYKEEELDTVVKAARNQRAAGLTGEIVGVLGPNVASEILGQKLATKGIGKAIATGKFKTAFTTGFKEIFPLGVTEGIATQVAQQEARIQPITPGSVLWAGTIGGLTAGTLGGAIAGFGAIGRKGISKTIEWGVYGLDPYELAGDVTAGRLMRGGVPIMAITPTYTYTGTKTPTYTITPGAATATMAYTTTEGLTPIKSMTRTNVLIPTDVFDITETMKAPSPTVESPTVQNIIWGETPTITRTTTKTTTRVPVPVPTETVVPSEVITPIPAETTTYTFTGIPTTIPTGVPTSVLTAPPLPFAAFGGLGGGAGLAGYGKGYRGWNVDNMIRDLAGEWRAKLQARTRSQQIQPRPFVTPVRQQEVITTPKQRAQIALDKMFGRPKKLTGERVKRIV